MCAQYFSKYEKHLINNQTIVKDLERQQDQWVTMLIKPQELNHARLYAIEARIQENEQMKMAEFDFLKDTVKKLIYAIEHNQFANLKALDVPTQSINDLNSQTHGQLPSLMKGSKSKGINRNSKNGSDGFFGQASHREGEMDFNKTLGSAITPKSKTNSSEILFLKRLLYLKASIDNESTLNTFSVPFEQEKRKEVASPSQLRLNS